jgi:MFS family permease
MGFSRLSKNDLWCRRPACTVQPRRPHHKQLRKIAMTTTAGPTSSLPQYNMRYVWAISLVAALGGLMFGYDWVVISGAKPFYERVFNVATAWEEGWAMGSALVGCLIGAVLSGSLSDRFGRKRLLILSALLFVVSAIGIALVDTFVAFNVWRIAGGVAIGLASNLSPMYIAEIAPATVRGRLVAMNQFTIVLGILLAQGANYGIDHVCRRFDERAMATANPLSDDLDATSRVAVAVVRGTRPGSLEKAEKDFGWGRTDLDGAPWDAAKVAKELAWQVPGKERQQFIEEFMKLAAPHKGTLNSQAVIEIVKEMNAARKKQGATAINAEDILSLAVAGRGLTSHNEQYGWRWMFGVTALPACLFFLLMFFVPESPRWLVKNGKSSKARGVLQKIGGGPFADQEVANIEATLVGEIEKVNFRDLLEPKVLWIVTLGATLATLQQWCGLNVIFYYAADLFRDAGYTVSAALLNIVIIGTVNMLFTVIAVNSVDRCGRRILMLIGFLGLAVIHTLIGLSFFSGHTGSYVLGLALAAMAVYSLTTAPVVWVVLSEIFPNRIRGAAMSISVFSLWLACFILTFTFPLLAEHLGKAYTFWLYGAICAVGFLFCVRYLPETKGKTLEEIERELVD